MRNADHQTAHDHSSLLILVRHLGSRLSNRTFSRLYERIRQHNEFRIRDGSGVQRQVIRSSLWFHSVSLPGLLLGFT